MEALWEVKKSMKALREPEKGLMALPINGH